METCLRFASFNFGKVFLRKDLKAAQLSGVMYVCTCLKTLFLQCCLHRTLENQESICLLEGFFMVCDFFHGCEYAVFKTIPFRNKRPYVGICMRVVYAVVSFIMSYVIESISALE